MTDLAQSIDDLGASALRVKAERDKLLTALSAAVGYMRNARIDLETGAPKRTAVATLDGGLSRAEAVLAEIRNN